MGLPGPSYYGISEGKDNDDFKKIRAGYEEFILEVFKNVKKDVTKEGATETASGNTGNLLAFTLA